MTIDHYNNKIYMCAIVWTAHAERYNKIMNIIGLTVYAHVNALDYNTCYSIIKIKESTIINSWNWSTSGIKILYCYLWHCNLTLTDCEVQGIGIGGTGDESCNGPCTPQAGDGWSEKRETQAASDPANHVAVGLVPLQCEQGGKAFVKNGCLLAHASRCGKDQGCKASSFDFLDSFIILSPLLHLM